MADGTSHQRNNKRWMWAALSNDVAFFQINSGRNQHAAKRQLCWPHILKNVIAIEESICPENQKIGEKLTLVAHSVFRCHHRYIESKITDNQYYHRLRRLRKSWLHWLKPGCYQCSKRYRGSAVISS